MNGKKLVAFLIFAMMAPVNRQVLVFADWSAQMQEFNAMAGAVRDHRMSSITWTRDPAGAPLPGVYAAIDLTSHYANVDRNCGYIILYQAPAGGDFQVMRVESNYLDNAHAQAIIESGPGANIDDIWAQLAASCPNYQP